MVEKDAVDQQLKKCKLQVKALKKVIHRYAEEINSFEVKSIPELKAFVNPADPAVKKVALGLIKEFEVKSGKEYSPQFLSTLCIASFHFISSLEPIGLDLPVSFWFSPSEVFELGAADAFDRCIFLCSLLTNLGVNSKIHVVELNNGLRHPLVIAQLDVTYVFDSFPPANYYTSSTQTEALAKFSRDGASYLKSLFEFNASSYEEFTE